MNVSDQKKYYCPMHAEIVRRETGSCPLCGSVLEPIDRKKAPSSGERLQWKRRFITALIISLPLFLFHFIDGIKPFEPELQLLVSTFVVFVPGFAILRKGLASFARLALNSFTLASVAILLAYGFSIYRIVSINFLSANGPVDYLSGLYFEPCAWIVTLLLFGCYLRACAFDRTLKELAVLKELEPKTAHLILEKGEERRIAIEDLKPGDFLRVKQNEIVPADGIISEGQSWVNESLITGESLPVYKRAKDRVLQGSLNGNGSFVMVAEKVGEGTLLHRLIGVITKARMTKAPLQDKVERSLAISILCILLISLLTLLTWIYFDYSLSIAVGHAVALLVGVSPEALLLSVPMAMIVGLGVGARNGILIRDAAALEYMEKVDTLVVDKTGVLTEGKPLLTKIVPKFPFSEAEVLSWAASVEQAASHPLAQAVVTGAKLKQLFLRKVSNAQIVEGKGVVARVEGTRVAVGNGKFLEDLAIEEGGFRQEAEKLQKEGFTVSYVALEDRVIGLLAVSDPLNYSAERSLQQLHREKLKIVMATGDSKEAAAAVAKRLKVDRIVAELLTQDKMALVQKLQQEGSLVAMAGDGLIDAPALAQADVGIALSSGAEPEIHNASITILRGDLRGVVKARRLSEIVMFNVRQNIGLSLIYNLIAIPFAGGALFEATGINITPLGACIFMSAATVLVAANSLRMRKIILYQD